MVLLGRLKVAEDAVRPSTISGATAAELPSAQAPAVNMAAEETYSLKSQIFSLENEVQQWSTYTAVDTVLWFSPQQRQCNLSLKALTT